jgi:DNA repair protein RadC
VPEYHRSGGTGGFRELSAFQIIREQIAGTPSQRRARARELNWASEVSAPVSDPARLRQRLIEAGPNALLDCEMLELVLLRVLPQHAAKALAERLLSALGDYNGAISATPARLCRIEGVSPAVVCELKTIEAAAHRLARARVMNRHALSGWAELMDYCRATMAHREVEHFRILFLDRKNGLIADEEQGRGTIDHVPVYPREVLKRAIELNSSAIILVHNHPSGDPTPSVPDIDMTHQIQRAAKPLGILVHDHVIVGRDRTTSFRSQGLL